jgi:hypothetical protein
MYEKGPVAGAIAAAGGLAYTGAQGLPWLVGVGISLVLTGITCYRIATRGRRHHAN